MKVLLDIGHPKDVNVFKNVIHLLQEHGHEVKIVARAKENTKKILDEYGFKCEYGPYYKSMAGKAFGVLRVDLWLYKIARKYDPDVFISPGSPYAAHVSKILGKPHLAFIDTEIANLAIKLMMPFTDKVYTSQSFFLDLDSKQEKFDSYFELAYLHPKYFVPDNEIPKKYDLPEKYVILRLSSLSSHHDIDAEGFSFKDETELEAYISSLEKFGFVLILSESSSWKVVQEHHLDFESDDLHSLLYYSQLYIGEGATMACEAAILGIPSIYVSNTRRGYLNDLEGKYGLVRTIPDRNTALDVALSILGTDGIRDDWQLRRKEMLDEKIDVVGYMVDAIENAT